MSRSKKKLSRRELIQAGAASALAFNPFFSLFEAILCGKVEGLLANEAQEALFDQIFINAIMGGGASRWHLDWSLRPKGPDSPFYPNIHYINKFTNYEKGNYQGIYEDVKIGDYYFPRLAGSMAPKAGGGAREISELFQNGLFIRGIFNLSSHPGGAALSVAPMPGMPSLNSLTAGSGGTPVPAIAFGADSGYRKYNSNNGTSITNIGVDYAEGANPILDIWTPFQVNGGLLLKDKAALEDAIDRTLLAIRDASPNQSKIARYLYQDRVNTKKFFKQKAEGLFELWNEKINRYEELVRRSTFDDSLFLSDLEDKPLLSDLSYPFSGGQGDVYVKEDFDITKMFEGGERLVRPMDRSAAFTEYLIEERICNSISAFFLFNHPTNTMNIPLVNTSTGSAVDLAKPRTHIPTDCHYIGAYVNQIYHTKAYRAVMACMLELVDKIKAKGLWEKTVIQLSSEFNRHMSIKGDDTGHGGKMDCTTFFTGKIKSPIVVGNLINNKTWGTSFSGKHEFLQNRHIMHTNVGSTLAMLLGIPTPFPNDISVIVKNGDGFEAIAEPKNVG